MKPVFGHTKERRGFRRFSVRGEGNVRAEWRLICLTGNLPKLFRAGRDAQNNIPLPMNFEIEIWEYWRNSPHRCLGSLLHIVGTSQMG